MFNYKKELTQTMKRLTPEFTHAEKQLVRGGFTLVYRPHPELLSTMHECMIFAETDTFTSINLDVISSMKIIFDANRVSWKKAYRLLRINYGKEVRLQEMQEAWVLPQGSRYRLGLCREVVESLEGLYLKQGATPCA